jgi:hypothetical protein
MARDYAKNRGKSGSRKKPAARSSNSRGSARRSGEGSGGSAWRWYFAGLLSGLFVSFMLYLSSLPPAGEEAVASAPAPEPAASEPPKPRFDFYTMLPEQNIDLDVEPASVANPRTAATAETYLLQAGSFRQREDADRRRAELLLLGLSPKVEETNSDNGRWFRVYLGPFSSHPDMARARSLTAGQDIDTLLLKRGSP